MLQIAIAKLDIDKDELLEVSQENEIVSVVSHCPPDEPFYKGNAPAELYKYLSARGDSSGASDICSIAGYHEGI